MIVLVCGSRTWTDADVIRRRLGQLRPDHGDIVITGGAPGADTIAGNIAHRIGLHVATMPGGVESPEEGSGDAETSRSVTPKGDASMPDEPTTITGLTACVLHTGCIDHQGYGRVGHPATWPPE